ncbi:amino acid ABC transporter permease [Listeria fleischmannii]|uniref:Amino acid ABC transporter permease n=1 Tax=Listeria fleischmannii TaxID=1069827 RepID=A0A841YF99_9LIST|nr:amino acid ABC transporter permease [Listeria fleischmannii]EIA20397.1 amino acid ABC transporter permease [Listeria fleischmannii subsp. coloradonensis]MBC1398946.1 amino acid ABC transporter permease [Listeria fleischmannii]MBC1427199.1 amino acid ABC transporter permease [Listeria fleischmannii]STY34002.1 L-cystine transport system permease protein tcyB [Listeria fleischmannii subsp. coloradonensis]
MLPINLGVISFDNLNWDVLKEAFWPMVMGGIKYTIPLALLSFIIGMAIALLIALCRLSSSKLLRGIGRAYVSIIRGTPLLVQLFVIFYGLPTIGLKFDPFVAAVIAFSLNVGGYAAEIVRGSIQSVPKGQWEAGYTIGMNYRQTLFRIIIPQAARVSVPPLSNTFISLVKDTSLASLVLVSELFRKAQEIAATSYEFLLIYMEAGLLYWILCVFLSGIQNRLERRLDRYVAK